MPGFRQGMIYEGASTPFPGTGVDLKLSQTKWTYSQGVIASGLGLLYTATGNSTYLTEAEKTIDAVVAGITANGILKENCDDVTHSSCNEDQVGSGIPLVWATIHSQAQTPAANLQGILGSPTGNERLLNERWQGIFTKHLQYYIDQAGSMAPSKYSVFLTIQSAAVHYYATVSDNVSRVDTHHTSQVHE